MKAREDFMDSTENSAEFKYKEYLRAYYAGCALTGLMSDYQSFIGANITREDIAKMAVGNADSLIAELNKK